MIRFLLMNVLNKHIKCEIYTYTHILIKNKDKRNVTYFYELLLLLLKKYYYIIKLLLLLYCKKIIIILFSSIS